MITLPRLTGTTRLIDPTTGLPTRQLMDFWNQLATMAERSNGAATFPASPDFTFSGTTLQLATDFVEYAEFGGAVSGGITDRTIAIASAAVDSVSTSNGIVSSIASNDIFITQTLVSFGNGQPTFVAPAGVIYEDWGDYGAIKDRAWISNGGISPLASLQNLDGAVHQYLLNETSGSIAHDTGATPVDAAFIGSHTLGVPGYVYGGATADGADAGAYVLCSYPEFTHGVAGAFSFEKVQNALAGGSGGNRFIHCGNGNPLSSNAGFALIDGDPGAPIQFAVGTTGGVAVAAYTPSATISPAHIICVYDGANIYLYVDGIMEATAVCPGDYVPSTNDIQIGNFSASGISLGQITQQYVAFYPSALSADQVGIHYTSFLESGPRWADMQAFTVVGSGIANSVTPGTNISFSLADETLQINAFLTLESGGTLFNPGMTALNITGPGALISGTSGASTIDIPGVEFSGTNVTALLLAQGLAGSVPGGTLSLTNSGLLALAHGTASATGTIAVGAGLSLSGTTLANSGITAIGTATGGIALGANLSLSGNTLSAAGGGGGSGTLGIYYDGTLYSDLAAASGFTLTGSGSTLTGSAPGGGGGGVPLTAIAFSSAYINPPGWSYAGSGYPVNAFPCTTPFTFSAGQLIEFTFYIERTGGSQELGILVSADGGNHYYSAFDQHDGNSVLYYNSTSLIGIGGAGAVGVMRLHLQILAGSSNLLVGGTKNADIGGAVDTNINLTSGSFTVYAVAPVFGDIIAGFYEVLN